MPIWSLPSVEPIDNLDDGAAVPIPTLLLVVSTDKITLLSLSVIVMASTASVAGVIVSSPVRVPPVNFK